MRDVERPRTGRDGNLLERRAVPPVDRRGVLIDRVLIMEPQGQGRIPFSTIGLGAIVMRSISGAQGQATQRPSRSSSLTLIQTGSISPTYWRIANRSPFCRPLTGAANT